MMLNDECDVVDVVHDFSYLYGMTPPASNSAVCQTHTNRAPTLFLRPPVGNPGGAALLAARRECRAHTGKTRPRGPNVRPV